MQIAQATMAGLISHYNANRKHNAVGLSSGLMHSVDDCSASEKTKPKIRSSFGFTTFAKIRVHSW